jgi:hypothetical protein
LRPAGQKPRTSCMCMCALCACVYVRIMCMCTCICMCVRISCACVYVRIMCMYVCAHYVHVMCMCACAHYVHACMCAVCVCAHACIMCIQGRDETPHMYMCARSQLHKHITHIQSQFIFVYSLTQTGQVAPRSGGLLARKPWCPVKKRRQKKENC